MRSTLRRVLARGAALLLTALVGSLALAVPGSPAAASGGTFTVTSAASFEEGQAIGSLLAAFPSRQVTDEYFDGGGDWHNWRTETPATGVFVEASCNGPDDLRRLPILFTDGFQLNLYWPDNNGFEPFGTCSYVGEGHMVIHPAGGGEPMTKTVIIADSHPGIFAVGDAPNSNYVDPFFTIGTPFPYCNSQLPSVNPYQCPVTSYGRLGQFELLLTGADHFVHFGGLKVQLAKVVPGGLDPWADQTLLALTSTDVVGREKAVVQLAPDTQPGEYRLRVVTNGAQQSQQLLHVEFGLPVR
jgi:hypothetical protein